MFWKKRKPDQDTLAADLRVARRSGLKTAVLVTLLVSGIVPALCMYWRSDDHQLSFLHQMQTMLAVTLHTYPLTLAVAIIAISRRQKWFHLKIGNWCFAGSVIIFCASLGNLISLSTGSGFIPPAEIMQDHRNSVWGIPAAVVNTIGGFYQAYGYRTFVASILIGSYAGATANRFISHIPKSKPEAAELALKLIEARKKAA